MKRSSDSNRELTKAEEQVMQILWELESAFVKDVMAAFPDPKPAYNTVSTIIRILESKGFVGHEAHGKAHKYHPLITKQAYAAEEADRLMQGYFGNSVEHLLSFFVKRKQVSTQELDAWLKQWKDSKP